MADLYFEEAARELYAQILREHLPAPPVMSCQAWADEFRHIAKGPERGRWRTSRTPYLAEPMACTDPDHPAQRVVMQFATQLGKSEVLYNAILKRIHLSPMDMMFVQPTLQDAKDHSRERFMPTVRATERCAERMPKPTSRDETNTWQTKGIAGGATLFFAGANAARSLASKPLPFVACDEVDGYPMDVDGEGDPLGLIWERMSNFSGRKLLLCSTPTLKDYSRIESEYLASDRRRYHVPCTHCGERQVLEWGADKEYGMKWLKTASGVARPDTAVYVCRHCGGAMVDRDKAKMLPEGIWIPENAEADGKTVGFHLAKLYSPVGWKSWPMLVTDWVSAMEAAKSGDSTKLKTFVNTSLAETWEDQGERADDHALRRRAAEIPLRQVHWGLYVATMGVDVQGDRLEAYVWAWGRGMERQLVDRQILHGDPSLPESDPASPWAALTAYREQPLTHASGGNVPLLAVMVDSGGHHTQAVYAYCRAHQASHVHAVKGASQRGKTILGKPSELDVAVGGRKVRRGVKLWPIGTDTAKAEIYGRLRLTEPGPGYVWLSKKLPSEVFDQLTAEKIVTRFSKGHARLEWIKPPGKRNEALDCAVYALAAAHWAGIDRWKEADWAKKQAVVEPETVIPAPVMITPPPPRRAPAPAVRQW